MMQSPFAHSCAATRRRLLPQRKGPPLKTAAKIGQNPEYYYFIREFVVQIHPRRKNPSRPVPGIGATTESSHIMQQGEMQSENS